MQIKSSRVDGIHVRSSERNAGAKEPDPATFVLPDFGGETRMGRSVEIAMMHAITWRPLIYEPLVCRIYAMSNGPNALAQPHAVRIRP